MSGRKQFIHRITDEIHVTGWNQHRYALRATPSAAFVSVDLRRFADPDSAQAEFHTTLRLSPALARQIATALVAAADEGEQAPATDDSIVDPSAPGAV